MEKRIRIVWILSLVSILLLISVQGYWLYNQYQYTLGLYAEEVADKVLKAGEKEYLDRKADQKGHYSFVINKKTEHHQDKVEEGITKTQFVLSLNQVDSLTGSNSDNIIDQTEHQTDSLIKAALQNNYLKPDNEPVERLNLNIPSGLSDDAFIAGINRAVANRASPFNQEKFDSILVEQLPDLSYTVSPLIITDSLDAESKWGSAGHLFSSEVIVSYMYSPFELKGVVVKIPLPVNPVFQKMAMQLVLAFGLILLLIACLIFQIKTIMKQQKLNKLRQSFVNTMIHELKRPVQTLKTFVSFLGDKEMRSDEKMTQQVIQDSMFELDNLSAYLSKLKDMVRADDTETPLLLSRFNLKELTEKVIRLTHIPNDKRVEFRTEFNMESLYIEADTVHIANVLSNLIENAIKYSGDDVRIKITANHKGNELWLTVQDNGFGIPLAEQDKVFVKFYRGSNIPNHNIPGLGLGLSYVKLISEAHRGNVSLKSRQGEGTSVTLSIPQ